MRVGVSVPCELKLSVGACDRPVDTVLCRSLSGCFRSRDADIHQLRQLVDRLVALIHQGAAVGSVDFSPAAARFRCAIWVIASLA